MTNESNPEEVRSPKMPYYGMSSPYGDFAYPKVDDGGGFSVFDLWRLFRRRWEIIVLVAAIGTISAGVYAFTHIPVYEATASILVEPENKVVELDSVIEGLGSDSDAIATQINLLKSRGFLEKFARASYLDDVSSDRAIVALEQMKTFVERKHGRGQAVAATIENSLPALNDDETFIASELRELSDGLEVSQKGRSYIIDVTYTSPDPLRAEEIANGVAQHFIAEQASYRREVTGEASDYLELRLEELKQELLAAEQAVQTYRASETLHIRGPDKLTSEQLSDLTTLVVRTRAERKEKEARIEFIEKMRREGSKLESLTEVLNSPYMVTLWEEESALRRREAEFTMELGSNHPKILTLRKERNEIEGRIDIETDRIIANTKNELAVLKERERSLTKDINELIGLANDDAASVDQASIKLRILEGEAAASRRMFEDFLIRFKETREQQAVIQPNARLITRAQIPSGPAGRGPLTFLLVGFMASSGAAFALAFLRDKVDSCFRSSKEIEAALNLPCLGQVPFMSQKKCNGKKVHEYLLSRPVSAYAESIRTIYTKILMKSEEDAPKIIQITSSLPAEGKTTFAVSLATLLAIDGKKTLLLDLDFRHPSVAREITELEKVQSLDEFLRGDSEITTSMVFSNERGCDVLGIKAGVTDPAALIRSQRLKTLIRQFNEVYDHIIIDGAPSLGLSDSKATFVHADTVIFAVQWNKTSAPDIRDAIDELKACKVDISGIVLTQVNTKQQRRYGYRGIDEYYGKHSSYYKN